MDQAVENFHSTVRALVLGDAVAEKNLVADLTYISYAHNRKLAPHLTPESWKRVYGEAVDRMEAQYQAEAV